eukprot:CAMPEP_0197684796 /NCGR_PEP_ID=MMETSP1338-20131121/99985_1 /TAXON_ID=43686 ORGANISM="Pelagodinium beii, Strain RCC1491" /NCGR_SAMPLE_ID=MMETSP1338 /ASSEMBLY_ACC=CAM_ASM_000754 /LENGTH=185 /DNA_ID=CAMNT_0043266549 /DNA_START=60 /DNA_END=618 /DNA_ORIENTATION=-
MVKVVAPVVVLFAMVAGEPSSFLASRDLQQVNSEDSGLAIECGDMSGDTTEFHLLGKACMTLDTDRQECCKQHLKNIARELPWWAWIAIAVGVVALIAASSDASAGFAGNSCAAPADFAAHHVSAKSRRYLRRCCAASEPVSSFACDHKCHLLSCHIPEANLNRPMPSGISCVSWHSKLSCAWIL